jgi:hypothetical protein
MLYTELKELISPVCSERGTIVVMTLAKVLGVPFSDDHRFAHVDGSIGVIV